MTKTLPDERVLNEEQKKAVEYGSLNDGGPLLIIAGAGTGKTTVITERIKHLILNKIVRPDEILALTFTEKASSEMEARIDQIMPYGYTSLWISTFHSFCERILKDEALHIGLNPSYRLLSDADSIQLFRKNLFSFYLHYFRPLGNPNKFISGLLQHFSRLKDEDVTHEQYMKWIKLKAKNLNVASEEEKLEVEKYQELARVYKQYEELKIKNDVMDFSDLISNTLLLFRMRSNILARYCKQFKFILVDEFQDTNLAQYELIKLLAPSNNNPNLTIVGDDNQAIYKFRGAAISNILSFQKDYPSAHRIVLSKNYRSYQYILDASYKLIKHNDPDTLEVRLGISKKLTSIRGDTNQQVKFIHTHRVEDEADEVVKEIKKLRKEKYAWKDIAILVRANNHADTFTRAFSRHIIPFQFLGPGELLQKNEIKELIAYLQVLVNWQDSVAFLKVLSMEYFSLSIRDLVLLSNYAKRNMISLFEASETLSEVKVSDETQEKITKITTMIKRHIELTSKETAGQMLYYFLQDCGMLQKMLEHNDLADEKKAENIIQFFNKLKSFETTHEDASVPAVLEWITLLMELGESPLATDTDWSENDAVNLLTVHSAKGLEFPVVFLVNLVSQRFPTTERREQIPIPQELIKEELPQGDFHIEEERRLFYVGMTRARDRLYFTASNFYGEGKRAKKLSPFISEVLEITDQKPLIKPVDQLSLLDWNVGESAVGSSPAGEVGSQFAIGSIKVTYLSYSQIETFRICPLHYKLSYILKIPTPHSPALSFGSTIHAVLKDIYEKVQQGKAVNKKDIKKLLDKYWKREGYESKQYESMMKKRGEEYLSGYFEKSVNPRVEILALEQPFTIPIRGKGRFMRVGGRIDRVDDLGDGRIEIIDYKTGKPLSQREVDASVQLSMYALAATEMPNVSFNRKPQDVVLSLYYFETQEKISTTRTREQLEIEKKNILTIASEIEKSDFTCSGHMFCQNCEYKLFCGINV